MLMIYNATILRIDSAGTSDPGGNTPAIAGNALKWRGCLSEPTARDKYAGFGLEEEGSMMFRGLQRDLNFALGAGGYASGFAIAPEQRLSIKPDLGQTAYYRVRSVQTQPHGAASVIVIELEKD